MAHILVVEDDPDILAMVSTFLDSYGHSVLACNAPSKALKAIKDGYLPDVACLDVDLPEMDGFHLWYRLHRHPRLAERELPTIFLSALDDPAYMVEGRALGATYIAKPFAGATLQRAITVATSAVTISGRRSRKAVVTTSS